MRYIDPSEVIARASADKLSVAEKALASLLEANTPDDRSSTIGKGQPVWAGFKDALAEASGDKCWYCETIEIRSDNCVDHFRPKARVRESPTHPGYWWLAFDYRNLRYACTFCNSHRIGPDGVGGGKQDSFPIVDETKRAQRPEDDLHGEAPMLLDPCDYRDVSLLWFDDTGMTRVNATAAFLDPLAEERVRVSARLYHLDHARLTAERRRVYADIADLCEDGDGMLKNEDMQASSARTRFGKVLGKLKTKTNPGSRYSAAAICALKGLRVTSETAELALKLA